MSLPQQLKLLMWKNFVVRRRQKLRVTIEILWPLSLFVLLMLVRSKGLYLRIHQCHFEDKPLPSAGQFLFWQGLVCSFNNTCHFNKSEAERNYTDIRSSDLSLLLNDAEAFTEMAMNKQEKRFTKLLEEIETLANDLRNGSHSLTSNDTADITNATIQNTSEKENENQTLVAENVSLYINQNLEKLMSMHKKIDVRLIELEPYMEITSLLKRININYENITGIVKAVPEVNEIFVRLHNFMCGNASKITIDMMLESRPDVDNLRSYLNSIRDAPATIEYHYDKDATKECNAIYKHLETSPHLKFIWRFLKPFVRGKIVFAPNSTVIQRVMSKIRRYTSSPNVSNFTNEQNYEYLKIDPVVYNASLENLKYILEIYKSQNESEGILSTVLINAFMPSIQKAHDLLISYQEQIHEFNSEHFTKMRKQLSEALKCYTSITIESFATEEEAEKRSMALSEKNELLAQITFNNSRDDLLDPLVRYKIRMNPERMSYSPLFSLNNGPNYRPFEDLKLVTYGFVYLQDMVEKSIINEHTNRTDTPGYVLKQLPHPCFVEDWFLSSLGGMFPLFMVLSWVYTASMIIKSIVYEKEQKLRETMRVLGMNNGIHWCSWFLDSIIPMVITVLVLSTVLVYGGVVTNAEYTLVALFLLCYAVSTITMCFLVSVFFSKANLAACSGGIVFFTTYLPFPLIDSWFPHLPPSVKELGSLLSNVALGMGSKYFALRELEGTGAKWSNAAISPLPNDSFSIIKIMFIFLLDAFIYFILAWYIENVFPGIYGIPKNWYFPFTLSYWCPTLSRHESDTLSEKESEQHDTDTTEAEPKHLEKGVAIKKLTKVYKNGKVAIKELSLNFYQDQITAFLGTNGAGKTTTISILTGLFTPTSGTAEIYGRNVRTHISYIRQNLGICPQYNILFPELTVQEHLWFFARLKGHSAGGVQVEVQTLLSDLGLYHKRDAYAKHLSGGMKRKLSIAIAFIGGSRTVVLDEPTAGVDPYSRMGIWNLLLKYKKGRTIILTTHNMAEADLLGDRIAIVDAGRLVCCGSNGFLKSRFGWGYVLTVDCNLEYRSNESMAHISKELTTGIGEIIPEIKVIEKFGTEIKFNLPKISGNIQLYQTLFEYLLKNKETLGISSFGFSDTSLEEIFLKLTSDKEEMSDLEKEESVLSFEEKKFEKTFKSDLAGQDKLQHLLRQFKALMVKRLWRSQRNKFEFIILLLVPAFLVCFCMSITKNLVVLDQPQPLDVDISSCSSLTLDGASQACTSFYQNIPNHSNWSKRYIEVVQGETGFGVACVDPLIARNRATVKCRNSTTMKEIIPKYKHTIDECNCDSGKFVCNFNTSVGRPELLITSTGHGFYNLTGRDIEDWILSTFDTQDFEDRETKRTGGFTFGLKLLMKGRNISTQFDVQNFTKINLRPALIRSKILEGTINRTKTFPLNQSVGDILQAWDDVHSGSWYSIWSSENFTSDYGFDTIYSGSADHDKHNSTLQTFFMQGLEIAEGQIKKRNLTSTMESWGMQDLDRDNGSEEYLENNDDMAPSDSAETCATQKPDPNLNPNVVDNIKIWFNNKWPLSPVVYLNGLNNVVLRASMPKNVSGHYGIKLTMQGMNLTLKQMQTTASQKAATGLLHSICILFSLSFVPASFSIYLIEERVTGCKHLQLLSGVNWVVYWLHAFCWDLVCHALSSFICLIILLCFQEEAYVGSDSLPSMTLLVLLYGWSSIPLMYLATFFFKVTSSAFVALACFNAFTGVLTTTTTYVLRLFEDEYLRVIKNVLSNIFLIFPHFCFGDGLMKLTESYFLITTLAAFDVKIKVNMFDWKYIGKNLTFMFVEGIIFFIGVLCYERFQRSLGFCSEQIMSLEPPTNLDEDVESERKRILDLRAENDVLVMKCLTKVYKPQKYVAVNQLCLGVDRGQCFGLIGLNGAGKTSTFKMLTGDTSITFGDARILGHSVRDNLNSVRSRIGYCPQFDALDSKLTPAEHLALYASLRNIPAKNIPDAVESCLKCFDLWRLKDVCTRYLSGGNKRKLSTAIAILGDPQMIFLDEPTCGMDPKARRFLWSRIKECVIRGQAVVLTSHSMSECEALCSRLSIMVNGQFMCLGSIQHLKNKFGKGYNLIIRAPLPRMAQVKKLMAEKIPEGIEKSEHYTQLKYHVNVETFSLFNVLTVLEEAREDGMILDYSLSQKSLGEVFLHFVSHQAQGKQPEGMSRCDCFRLLCCPGKLMTPSHISSSDELRMPFNY